MYKVGVRDHVMIAHSFRGELFGPAQQLHGATYVVDAVFKGERIDPHGVLLDIGRAHTVLREALADLAYQNLDALPELAGQNTTTEFMAKLIFDRLALAVTRDQLGPGSDHITSLEVILRESHLAFAAYEAPVSR